MKRTAFNDGWSYRIWGVPGEGIPVSLPHDLSISLPRSKDALSSSAGGFYQCKDIIYDRNIHITSEMLDERIILEFEGIMANAQVYLDDTLIAKQYYGYTTFHANLTPYLREGIQKLRINTANNAQPCSRWYTGCGIYRPVWLLRAPKTCIKPWGLFVFTTHQEANNWKMHAKISVSDDACQIGAILCCRIIDVKGCCLAEASMIIRSSENRFTLSVSNVIPWSPGEPILYRCEAELLIDGMIVDCESTLFGFRTVALDPNLGLLLNGQPVKLHGGCVHHDNGLLGAASHADAEIRKARLLKENGFNAVRCAHNPPSPAFLDACDKLGVMVMNEFTDVWNIGKNPYDYHLFFQENWENDLRAMVMRDRNHPSIIFWSIGNEIPERDGSGQGYLLSHQLSNTIRSLDNTRLITAGLNNIGKRRLEMQDANLLSSEGEKFDYFGELSRHFLEPLDVAGYNYLGHRYESDLIKFPDRYFCGTESVAKESWTYWQLVIKHPRIIGDFAWTAIDYLGESGIGHVWYRSKDGEGYFERYPWRQANCADIDLCGYKRPCSYYRDAVWGRLDRPYIAIQHPQHYHDDGDVSYWAWPERFHAWDYPGYEGQPIQVDVYSTAKSVKLFLNGQYIDEQLCRECIAVFDTIYIPGTLEAVDSDGHCSLLCSPGTDRVLDMSADSLTYDKAGRLIYLTVSIIDKKNSTKCVFDNRKIHFVVQGGTLLAVGSANPASEESFASCKAHAWNGCVCAVILTCDATEIIVSAHSTELAPVQITLKQDPSS
ncbi:MAG: glycoside hydrolase family 2 TIM barrel-domain containing protein [Christensenellales bacterium]|jgi:beta-galactosidase